MWNLNKEQHRVFILSSLLLMLAIFSNCGKSKKNSHVEMKIQNSENSSKESIKPKAETDVLDQEPIFLNHEEIPLPLESSMIEERSYKSNIDIESVKNFYNQMLEIEGWTIESFENNNDYLILCKKPNRSYIVSVNPLGNTNQESKTLIRIYKNQKSVINEGDKKW